ncbi:LysR family transcriptional regulator [Vreelandella subglaciescola]|jgi:DNA-binding transcriptional LysR family regulator|uniref:Transcriptional regulator, LysR family n=1 Tax=Vreelandella subglaciescola TaxID=29571 RepID=A0A1M7E8D1_9GAMM|nr:LysR family transcriptional regulator [Halomonas subglaciescola]SHL87916.1 transcriptional regulator, LysR family [Halomonas subglaciescola]
MEIRWLEDFIALARTRHFSRAADEQHVTQPTFSRRIKLLEEEMGVTLINRQTLPLSLTSEGDEFLALCETITEGVRLTRDRMRDISAGHKRRISVAAPQSLLARFLPEWLGSMGFEGRMQPYLRATGWVAADYFKALNRGECDLALCYWPLERCDLELDTSACSYRTVGHERLIPVTATTAQGAPLTTLPASRQAPAPWLAYPKLGLLGAALETHLARMSHNTCLSVKSENLYAASIKELVLLGYGMSWLPERTVRTELENGTLTRAGDSRWDVPLALRLYRHQQHHHAELDALWSELSSLRSPA